jgi:predicted DsbA family dithiol-disulfide isomerase
MLRPPGSPPMSPEHRKRIEESRPAFNQRAREQYGVEVHPGPFEIDSRPALIAEKYAGSQDKGNAFHDAVMHAYWQEARDISDQNLLKEIAAHVGLPIDNFDTMLASPAFEGQVDADIEQAHEYGLDAVPALIFAEKYLVMGAQPYAVLKQVVERVQQEG